MKAKYLFLPAIALLTACSQDDDATHSQQAYLGVEASVKTTRAAEVKTEFVQDDVIYLYVANGDNELKEYDHTPAVFDGAHWAIGKGGIPLQQNTSYNVWALYGARAGETVSATPGYRALPQREIMYATGTAVNTQSPTTHLEFHYALPRLTFRISRAQLETTEEMVLSELRLSNMPDQQYPVECYGIIDKYGHIGKPDASHSYKYLWLYPNDTLVAGKTVEIDVLAMPYDSIPLTAVLNLSINNKYREGKIKNVQWLPGMHYIYNVNLSDGSDLAITQTAIIPRTEENAGGMKLNGDFGSNSSNFTVGGIIGTPVDLGLSVKWADHNLGATYPQDLGKQVMWGDVTGNAQSDEFLYEIPLDKSGKTSSISGSEYDIATVQWGKGWRLPSEQEAKELIDNCSFTNTNQGGVYGCLITSKVSGYTNNRIFVPYQGKIQTSSGVTTDHIMFWMGEARYWSNYDIYYGQAFTFLGNYDNRTNYINQVIRTCYVRPVYSEN